MSRIPSRPHDNMLGAYGFRGFPSMAVLSAGGAKLGEPEGRDIESFTAAIDTAKKVVKEDADAVAEKEKEASQAIKKAHKKKGFLGVQAAGESEEEKGAAISVLEGGAAAKAGLQDGDSIFDVDGTEVKTLRDLAAYLSNKEPGDEVTIKLLRDGKEKTIKVKLGSR